MRKKHKNNITLMLRNINAHLTETKENITLRVRSISLCSRSTGLCLLVPMLCLLNVIFFDGLVGFTNPPSTSALSSQNNTNIEFTLNPTLSLSLSGSLSLLGLQPGTSADSNVITIDIGTNNVTGYTLSANVGNNDYAHGGTNYNANDLVFTNGALIPSPTTTNKFTSLSTADSYPTLDNESIADNTWGYSYMVSSSDSDSSSNNTWSNYSGLPIYTSTSSKTIYETTTSSHDSIKFKLGARAASNQVAGTYTNVVNFMAVTNAVPMSISDAFAAAGAEQVNGYYTMQDMTSSICGAVELEGNDSVTELIDIRDGEVYKISKLKDGNCWMLDNLRLDPTAVSLETLKGNTNASDTALTYLKEGGGTAPYPASGVENGYGSAWKVTYNLPYIYNGEKNTSTSTIYGKGSNKLGIYYNYCAVSAGSYCYPQDNGADVSNSLLDIACDICPASWRLPTSDIGGEYDILLTSYGQSTSDFTENLSLIFSGYLGNGIIVDQDTRGDYWAATFHNKSNMYGLTVARTFISPHNSHQRTIGKTVRCLAK